MYRNVSKLEKFEAGIAELADIVDTMEKVCLVAQEHQDYGPASKDSSFEEEVAELMGLIITKVIFNEREYLPIFIERDSLKYRFFMHYKLSSYSQKQMGSRLLNLSSNYFNGKNFNRVNQS